MRVWVFRKTTDPTVKVASKDVDALVDKLNGDPTPRTVVVFPAGYAEKLAGRIQHKVVPLSFTGDPTPVAIQAALGTVLPLDGLVDVVMVSQDATDAIHQVRAVLEQHMV